MGRIFVGFLFFLFAVRVHAKPVEPCETRLHAHLFAFDSGKSLAQKRNEWTRYWSTRQNRALSDAELEAWADLFEDDRAEELSGAERRFYEHLAVLLDDRAWTARDPEIGTRLRRAVFWFFGGHRAGEEGVRAQRRLEARQDKLSKL